MLGVESSWGLVDTMTDVLPDFDLSSIVKSAGDWQGLGQHTNGTRWSTQKQFSRLRTALMLSWQGKCSDKGNDLNQERKVVCGHCWLLEQAENWTILDNTWQYLTTWQRDRKSQWMHTRMKSVAFPWFWLTTSVIQRVAAESNTDSTDSAKCPVLTKLSCNPCPPVKASSRRPTLHFQKNCSQRSSKVGTYATRGLGSNMSQVDVEILKVNQFESILYHTIIWLAHDLFE